jgi:prophage maintenance system killer protein
MALYYLTLQDVLNLGMKVTKSPQTFDAFVLEEATFFQYAWGQSTDLAAQGARFLQGFVKKAPFPAGNEAIAFAGLLVFLEANGKTLRLGDDEAAEWVETFLAGEYSKSELAERLVDAEANLEHGVPNLEKTSDSVIARYPNSLGRLLSEHAATT